MVGAERGQQHLAGVAFVLLIDLDDSTHGERHTRHVDDALEACRHQRLIRASCDGDLEQPQIFRRTASDTVEDRIPPSRDGADLEYVIVADRNVVAHKLAEWALGPAHARKDTTFDHDFGVDWDVEVEGAAAPQLQRRAGDLAGDLQFALIVSERGCRSEHQSDRWPQQDGRFERLATCFGFGLILSEMMRSPQPDPQLAIAHDLAAV